MSPVEPSQPKVGDAVKPKPEWLEPEGIVPSGCITKIVPWGRGHAFYVEGDHRAYGEYAFERA